MNVLQHCSSGHLCLDHLCNAEQPTSPYSLGQTAQPSQGSGLPGDPQTGGLSHPATGTDAHTLGQGSHCHSGQRSQQADEAQTQKAFGESSHSGTASATANDILLLQDAYSNSCSKSQQAVVNDFSMDSMHINLFAFNVHHLVCMQHVSRLLTAISGIGQWYVLCDCHIATQVESVCYRDSVLGWGS